MKKYTKPVIDVKEFRAKETVASLAEWLAANSDIDITAADAAGSASYYFIS